MKNHCYRPAAQGFWNFVRLQSREIRQKSFQIHASLIYLRLISANGAVFTINWQIYFETSSLQREKDPKLRLFLDYYCEKLGTGQWPVHDIKSFAIGAFLSSSLLKEQMMICDKKKKNLVRDNTKCKRDRQASGGFEHKIAGFKKATFMSSRCSCCCCCCTG